jgi:hypothetical protein
MSIKERPILFRAPMIRAILSGQKTQTRRVVKGIPPSATLPTYYGAFTDGVFGHGSAPRKALEHTLGWFVPEAGDLWPCDDNQRLRCPYGNPGDHLWVRETFVVENTRDYHGEHNNPMDDRPIQKINDPDGNYWLIPHFRATEPEPHIVPYRCDADDDRTRWTPAIHMPRWASRITLEIISVRVERLAEISQADCIAEGMVERSGPFLHHVIADYRRLWTEINGAESWLENPYVWVIEFNRIKSPNAQLLPVEV